MGIDQDAEKWKRKAERGIREKYKQSATREEFVQGVADYLGISPSQVNQAVQDNYAEEISNVDIESMIAELDANEWKENFRDAMTQ